MNKCEKKKHTFVRAAFLKGCEQLGVGSPPPRLRVTGHLLPVRSLKRTTVH